MTHIFISDLPSAEEGEEIVPVIFTSAGNIVWSGGCGAVAGAQSASANTVYPPIPPEPIPESEEERKERMWRAVVESCGRSK